MASKLTGLAMAAMTIATASYAADFDWKLYGIADAGELCFYNALSVVQTPNGHVRVGTKCLLHEDIVAIDPKQELGNKILAEAAKKLKTGYVPPILVGAETDNEQITTTIAYEQAADMSGIAPHSSIFYELDCAQKMMRELNTNISVNGQQGSSSEPNGQFVPPEENGKWLLKLLCPQPNSTVAPPDSTPFGGQNNEAGAQPKANPSGAQQESNTVGSQTARDDAQDNSRPGQSEPGSSNQQPLSKVLITIDKTKQRMTVLVDGTDQYDWPVSTGRAGYSTPSGTFTPTSMNEVWYSKQWDNSPMPHSIFFMKDGHAIHGSYEVKSLGKPVSHGCVRISPQNATILFDLVRKNGMENTKVVLSGETPGGEYISSHAPSYDGGGEDFAPWFAPGQSRYSPPTRGFFGGLFQPRPYGQWFRP
jgi:lipoprotein-anchoring transpeptidase ErfK/SrfK